MPKKNWWPTAMPDQLVLVQNFQSKLTGYGTVLGLSAAQLTSADDLCDAFVQAFNLTEQCKATMIAMTNWRDQVFNGAPIGSPAAAAPVFPVAGPTSFQRGIVPQFFALRDLILASPGYTDMIGADLGIVGTDIPPKPPAEVVPVFKSVNVNGNTINLVGSMQSMDAVRVEYARTGDNFAPVAFLTNTPGGFQITHATPNQPETGHIRAVFIKRNADFGNYYASYPVTIS